MPELPYVPASELVIGMELKALPDGYVPLGAVMVIKTLDPDGDIAWHTRYPKDIHHIECLGALHAAVALIQHDVMESYTPDEED